uniref:uncharacterized protein LOC108949977 n=1 Tax=Ciona intestinalis TaxID=7719 RepID=UPI000180C172|nr:uncharacterized protein LOC108949977 [Ciona intestinalis]|eukprot:XP_018669806.1 uncharacterized protein LOC108949977 [Ciona intestinalis]
MTQGMPRQVSITYRLLHKDDIDDVIELLSEHYVTRESTSKCLFLTKEEILDYSSEIAREAIPQGLSLGAFDDVTNKLCGVTFGEYDLYKKPKVEDDTQTPIKIQYLQRLYEMFESISRVELGITNLLLADLLVVSPQYSNRGIGTQLATRQADLLADLGFNYLLSFITSEKALAIHTRLGSKCIKKVDIGTYRDSCTGVAAFKQAELKDNCIQVMCIDLQGRQSTKSSA